MIITIRVTDIDGILIKRYARFNRETVTNLIKRLVLGKIEDDYNELLRELGIEKEEPT